MDQVPIANRYSGAWGEINTRLQSRQNVNITFTTIVATAIGLMWSEKSPYIENVGYVLPSFGLATTFWVCHNDSIIGLLSKYCAECEKMDSSNTLPAWHTPEQGWIKFALSYRLWADRGFKIVLGLILLNNFSKIVYYIWGCDSVKAGLFLLSMIPDFFAFLLISRQAQKRNEILEEWEFKEGKLLKK